MKDIPIIVATSRDLTDAERAALEVKAFAVLTKRDLLSSVVAAVGAASRHASWQEVP